jgi:hypothetical protein
MVPSELTSALKALSSAFDPTGGSGDAAGANGAGPDVRPPRPRRVGVPAQASTPEVTAAESAAATAAAKKELAAAEEEAAAVELPGVPGTQVSPLVGKGGSAEEALQPETPGPREE